MILIAQAVQQQFWAGGLLGGLLLFQAITNTGCCGAGGCAVPPRSNANKKVSNVNPIEYEEVQ